MLLLLTIISYFVSYFLLFYSRIKLSPEAVPTLKPPPTSQARKETSILGDCVSPAPTATCFISAGVTPKSETKSVTEEDLTPDPQILFKEFLQILRELYSPPWTITEDENVLQVFKVQSVPPAYVPICVCQLLVFKNSGELTLKKFGQSIDIKSTCSASLDNGELKLTERSVNALLTIMFKISEKDMSKHLANPGLELVWHYKVKVHGWYLESNSEVQEQQKELKIEADLF